MGEKLLTVAQAAERLHVSQPTVRKWADTGKIPVVKLPNGYRRFQAREIDRVRHEMGIREHHEDGAE